MTDVYDADRQSCRNKHPCNDCQHASVRKPADSVNFFAVCLITGNTVEDYRMPNLCVNYNNKEVSDERV